MWDFTWRVSDCEELVGLLTGDDGVGFSSSTETGPETSSSKFRDYYPPRRSNRDAYCFRCLPDCFPIRYQGSNRRDYSMPSPFGQLTGYGPAYFRNDYFRCEYRQSRMCCYLHLYCFHFQLTVILLGGNSPFRRPFKVFNTPVNKSQFKVFAIWLV